MAKRLLAALLSIFWTLPAYAQFSGFSGGGFSPGPPAAGPDNTYVLIGTPPPELPEARQLVGSSPISIIDSGPGGSATIGITTPITPTQGGTGLAATGANGNVLTASGGVWVSSAPSAAPQTIASFSTTATAIVGFNTVDSTGGGFTFTLPPAASAIGQTIEVKYIGSANDVIVDGDGSETIDGQPDFTLTASFPNLTVISNGTTWFIK